MFGGLVTEDCILVEFTADISSVALGIIGLVVGETIGLVVGDIVGLAVRRLLGPMVELTSGISSAVNTYSMSVELLCSVFVSLFSPNTAKKSNDRD